MYQSKSNLYPPCKKHPKHRQSPGICSVCLTERLSNVIPSAASSSATKRSKFPSSSSSSPSSSSSDVSSCASPLRTDHHSKTRALIKFPFGGNNSLLSKSKSVAAVGRPHDRPADGEHDHKEASAAKGKKKSKGFWSKLLSIGILPRGSKRISNDLHLHPVPDHQGYMYSQPLTRDVDRYVHRKGSLKRVIREV